jgi:hypothetical protein
MLRRVIPRAFPPHTTPVEGRRARRAEVCGAGSKRAPRVVALRDVERGALRYRDDGLIGSAEQILGNTPQRMRHAAVATRQEVCEALISARRASWSPPQMSRFRAPGAHAGWPQQSDI